MKDGAQVVVTLGGDGTVNEAANGLMGSDTALMPLPGGSTNVFARSIGYPNNAVEATRELLIALEEPAFVSASLGIANGRAFVFHVGVGFDATVVARVEERGPLKRYAGHPWFVASALAAWMAPERRKLSFTVTTDDGRSVDGAQMAVAMNVNPYTYLGSRPLDLAPEAALDTPLSVIATTSLSASKLVPAASAAFRKSTTGLPNKGPMCHWPDVYGATITSKSAVRYQLDGEPQSPVHELRLEHRPDALMLVVPRQRPQTSVVS
jgi:diacylglycerol kinase family enzyme